MRPEDQNDLAVLQWERLADLLRSHGVHEDEIRKSGQAFKQGFVLGFQAGYEHEDEEEELEPAVGFAHKPQTEECEE